MRNPVERFTSRVDNYVRYRPSYPAAVLDLLAQRCGLTAHSRVADMGSGTGILTRLLLQRGARVWGIEPNQAMRTAAEQLLVGEERFQSVAATAEASTLHADSIDLITAGQAFHWFDVPRARAEFARILVRGGWVALIWNEREKHASAFLDEYERLLLRCSREYRQVSEDRSRAENPETARHLFGHAPQVALFANPQRLSFEHLLGRLQSSSYSPQRGDPEYEPMTQGLREVFARHQHNGEVAFAYETRVYYGQLS